jgi:hypothetical protein
LLCVVAAACSPSSGNINNGKRDLAIDRGDGFIDFIDMARNTTSCVGGGMTCSSSNPGSCDKGTITCDGPLAMCTPDSQIQDCYEGPTGTAGKGVCKAGTQSCVGALGPCLGQVLPAMKEDCSNDLDDDCDGTVNNGCPYNLEVGAARMLTVAPGTPPGNANQINLDKRCPANSFLYRVDLKYNDNLYFDAEGITLYCASPTLAHAPGSMSYTPGSVPVDPQPYDEFRNVGASVPTGNPDVANCNTGTTLRAIRYFRGRYDAGGFVGTCTQCATYPAAAIKPDNTLAIASTGPYGSDVGYDFGVTKPCTAMETKVDNIQSKPLKTWECMANEVMIGFKGVASGSIDQLQPICAPLVTKYKL